MFLQRERTYKLTIGDLATGEAVEILPPLNIRFDIEKNIDNTGNLNNANFEVYNLSINTRTKFERIKYPYIRFECGYKDIDNSATIFIGNATSISSSERGGDVITKIQAGEAFIQLHSVLKPFTVPSGRPLAEVVQGVVNQMQNIALGTISTDMQSSLGKPLLLQNTKKQALEEKTTSAYPVDGTPFQVFNQLADEQNIQWRIDRNKVYFRNKGGAFSSPSQEVFLLSEDTGLIGLPAYISKRSGVVDSNSAGMLGVSITALLNPNIFPESLIAIKSKDTQIDGTYLVRRQKFKGEYAGNDWYIEMDAYEVKRDV